MKAAERDLASVMMPGMCELDAELGSLTTYRVGGTASVGVYPKSVRDLKAVARYIGATSCKVLIVGRGSNLLVADSGFDGLAIFMHEFPAEIALPKDETSPVVVASGNTLLPRLARQCANSGWRGLEWAVGVPGTVGGAVRMNAGGHGSDVADALIRITVFDLRAGESTVREAESLGLRFRGSSLTPSEIVLEAQFKVRRGEREEANSQLDEIVRWRRDHQPGGQNAGSVFVNPKPHELSAGAVIDDLGLRGRRVGTAEVSTKHANFIQADPDGSADDVVQLMCVVRAEVMDKTGIDLRSEIRLIGFDDEMTSAAGGSVQAL